jgi:hypothetical protein
LASTADFSLNYASSWRLMQSRSTLSNPQGGGGASCGYVNAVSALKPTEELLRQSVLTAIKFHAATMIGLNLAKHASLSVLGPRCNQNSV